MFVVAEITRLKAISNYLVPTKHPFVVAVQLYYGASNEQIADFWTTTFGVTEPTTQKIYVTGIVYNSAVNYDVKESLADCLTDDKSFYWDNNNQILYIHYQQDHHIDLISLNFSMGIAVGLTNDRPRYFDDRFYAPYLLKYPIVSEDVDPFNYDKLSTVVADLQCDNKTGFFNQFKTVPLYGNKVIIKTGENGDSYSELIQRATYFVDDYDFSKDVFNIHIQDVRKTFAVSTPIKILSTDDYPNLGDNFKGRLIPYGYSPENEFLHNAEGLCINEKEVDSSHDPKFIFLEKIVGSALSDIKVYVKSSDEVWIEQTSGVSVDWSTGIVTVSGAKTGSSPYSVLQVRADVKGVLNSYASDIIKDLNDRLLSIQYDASNYDTTEWEAEEIYLDPITLYMNETKNIYDWIREIQGLSTVGFRYATTANDKLTIRVNNPNRSLTVSVPQIHIQNPANVVAVASKEDLYNKVYCGYNESYFDKTAEKVIDESKYEESFAKYRITRIYDKISGLVHKANAEDRAALQEEDYSEIHKVFKLKLLGTQYLDLRLYDIIEVDLTLRTKIFKENDVVIVVFNNDEEWRRAVSASDKYNEMLSPIEASELGIDYFGTIRGQIISIAPDYSLGVNTIKLRERAYSTKWEDIYG